MDENNLKLGVRANMLRYVRFLLLFCIIGDANAQVLIDYVVAVVNGKAVTRSELDTELNITVILGTNVTKARTTAERRDAFDTLINRKLVLQESQRLGIVVTQRDTRVAEKIAEIRARYTSDAAFESVLRRHSIEDEVLKGWVYEQLVYDECFRRLFFNALSSSEIAALARSYYDANTAEFVVPPTVTFNVLSILIPKHVLEAGRWKARGLVQQLYLRLQQGETFEDVREVYETQLIIKLEVLTLEVDTPLGAIVAELQNSDRSELFPISNGYQIVERIRSDPARQKTYAEVSEEVRDRIQQEKAETEFAAWLVEQREKQNWHILDHALK